MLRQEFLLSHDRFDEAEKRIEEALKVEPTNGEYLKMKARGLDLRGKKLEANRVLLDLASIEKDPWAAYNTIATNYESLGFHDSAIYIIKKFSQIYPGDKRASGRILDLERKKSLTSDTASKMIKEVTPVVPN